jgi:hypothetical protein
MTAPRTNAGHDQNNVATLIGVSTTDGITPVPVEVDPTTGQLQVSSTGGGGGGTQYAEDTASTAAEQLMMAGVVRKDTGATLVDTDGDRTELQVDASGNLRINATGNVAGAAADSGNPVKAGGVYNSTRPTYTNGQRTDLQTDTRGSIGVNIFGQDGITTASFEADSADATATSATANNLKVKGRAQVFNGTSWDRQRGDTTGTYVVSKPGTSGGFTTFHLVSAATTNATNIKASAGQVFGWYIYNSNATARKVAFHNTAGSPTAGTSVFFSIVIPSNAGANVFTETGIAFSTGIAITTVTDLTDAGTTAVGASDLIINIFYT